MAATTYTVRAGDTLGGIARRFGVTVARLRALNPIIRDPDHIEVGWVLTIQEESMTDYAIVVNVAAGSARSSDSRVKPARDSAGVVSVTFPEDISRFLWQATLGAADDTAQNGGSITTELGPMGSTDIVTVRTFDAAGNAENRPFHLHVRALR